MRGRWSVTIVALLALHMAEVRPADAAIVSYAREFNDTGPMGPMNFGTAGFDLYATSPLGAPTSTGPVPFGPIRVSQLPGYIQSVTSAGSNAYYKSSTYAQIFNPLTSQMIHSGLTFNHSASSAEKDLLAITIGANPPPIFYVGYVTDNGDGPWDYPDALRFRQTTGLGGGDSALITTVQDANQGIDIYFFSIAGAVANDVITISGFETIGGVDYKNLTAAGLVFSNIIPEPASSTLLLAAMGMLVLRRSRQAIPS